MKMSKKASKIYARIVLALNAILFLTQVVLLTLKLAGVISWSWWLTLSPFICTFGLPLALIMVAVIVLTPKAVIEDRRYRKRVEAEALKYGIEKQPGESTGDLKKRIARRNMIAGGNYSRKAVKDAILEAFPDVGSCQIETDYQRNEIILSIRPANTLLAAVNFSDDTLREIKTFAAQFLPISYRVIVINVEDENYATEE